jgi:hypothetical protein
MAAWRRRLVLAAVSLAVGESGYRMHLRSGVIVHHDPVVVSRLAGWTVFFFLLAVLLGVAVGEAATQLQTAEGPPSGGARRVVEAVAASLVVRGLAAALPFERAHAVTTALIGAAVLGWAAFECTRAGLILGIGVAVVATSLEVLFVDRGLYRYASELQHMWNVPAWLPAVYFSIGVAASQVTRALNGVLRVGK